MEKSSAVAGRLLGLAIEFSETDGWRLASSQLTWESMDGFLRGRRTQRAPRLGGKTRSAEGHARLRASAGNLARPFGHVSERATQRLEAESALVLVRRSCRGGARALPRHSELLAAGAHASRESGHMLALLPRMRKTRPITRRAFVVEGGSTSRRSAALRRASDVCFLESALGADERARLGREPQPHENQ